VVVVVAVEATLSRSNRSSSIKKQQ